MDINSSDTPQRPSTYARSPALQWGMWIIVFAAAFFAWSVMRKDKPAEQLQTIEGTVVDYRPEESAKPIYLLRVQKSDGAVLMFGSWEDLKTPKSGWQKGQPIKVSYDPRKKLYKVTVADEVILDIMATQPKGDDLNKKLQLIAGVAGLVGLSLMIAGYALAPRAGEEKSPSG